MLLNMLYSIFSGTNCIQKKRAAFATPLLVKSGSGQLLDLFSYFLILIVCCLYIYRSPMHPHLRM